MGLHAGIYIWLVVYSVLVLVLDLVVGWTIKEIDKAKSQKPNKVLPQAA
jgi:hypothetical protein